MASHSQPRNARRILFAIVACAAIFAADVLLDRAFPFGAAYLAWLLISFGWPGRTSTRAMATAATTLIAAGFFLARADGSGSLLSATAPAPILADAASRALAAAAVWLAAILIQRRKRSETRQRKIEARRRASLRALGEEPDALDELAAGYLVAAQEDERSRLARELHDDFVPRLAVAAMEMQALRANSPQTPEQARSAAALLKELEQGLRRFCGRLYPMALDRLNLSEAIESECLDFEERSGVWVDFESRGVPRTLPKEVAVCLYRVCQESLNNVAKHSRCREARVLLEASDDGLTLMVSDLGVGFDPEATKEKKGLLGMRERARLAGGRFEVRSRRGAGTEIVAFVPVAWTDEGLAAAAGA